MNAQITSGLSCADFWTEFWKKTSSLTALPVSNIFMCAPSLPEDKVTLPSPCRTVQVTRALFLLSHGIRTSTGRQVGYFPMG